MKVLIYIHSTPANADIRDADLAIRVFRNGAPPLIIKDRNGDTEVEVR